MKLQTIPTKLLLVSKLNTRQPKPADVAELAESINALGQIAPIVVRPHPKKDGHFEIASGARRRVACDVLKIDAKCLVRPIPDDEFEDMILADNLQRTDPDPLQELILIERRLKAGATPNDIAARYGKTESWIKRRMKLSGLTPEARDAWADEEPLAHYTVEMMEYLGSLPPADQQEIISDPYQNSLRELIQYHRGQAKNLADVPWLNDPASFVEGCGPGCSSNTAETLFPDPEHPCGQCTNGDCFRSRAAKFADSKLTALLDGCPISEFRLISTTYQQSVTYQGEERKVLYGWDLKQNFTTVKKAAAGTVKAIDITDPTAPAIVHLKAKPGTKAAAQIASGVTSTADPADSRESKLTVKRLAALNKRLDEHIRACPVPEFPVSLAAAFGLTYNHNYRGTREDPWETYDQSTPEQLNKLLWDGVRPILCQRISFQKQSDLLHPSMTVEMDRIGAITAFDKEAEWHTICTTTVPVPKSWGKGIDPITLQPSAK